MRALSICLVASFAWAGCKRAPEPTPHATEEPAPAPPATNAAARSAAAGPTGSSAPAAAAKPLGGEGKELYDRYCKLCHGADGVGYAADNAPSLVSRTFLESATDAFIAQGIRVGRPNTPMAAYGELRGGPLTDAQIASIVAYLRSAGPAPIAIAETPIQGDPQRGKLLYQRQCSVCHGTDTKRGPTALQVLNPELLAAATPGFLRHAIVHGRPPTPMPAFGGKLTAPQIDDILAWFDTMKPKAAADVAPTKPELPKNLPLVINPRGGAPKFTLREDRFVSAAQVKDALAAKKRLVIVDARAPSDWLEFHIPGAVSLPYYDVKELKRIPNDGTWVIAYCACPHHASGEVVDALRREKYPNTAVLDEGILFWRDRGYPLEGNAIAKGSRPPEAPSPKPPPSP